MSLVSDLSHAACIRIKLLFACLKNPVVSKSAGTLDTAADAVWPYVLPCPIFDPISGVVLRSATPGYAGCIAGVDFLLKKRNNSTAPKANKPTINIVPNMLDNSAPIPKCENRAPIPNPSNAPPIIPPHGVREGAAGCGLAAAPTAWLFCAGA